LVIESASKFTLGHSGNNRQSGEQTMIEITRSQARVLRSVLRRAMNLPARGPLEPQVFKAGRNGLTVRVASGEFAAEYRFEGSREAETLVIPPSLLVDCEGRSKSVVRIETIGNGRIASQWNDGNVPQLCSYAPAGEVAAFPDVPAKFVELEPRFATAYRAACSVREADPARFAIDHVLLRGKAGEVAGTDGKQIYIEKGFTFPFNDDVLVPASGVFSCSDLKHKGPIGVAKSDDWLALRVGPLALLKRINKEGRFPQIKDVIPRHRKPPATLELADVDAAFLADAVKRLPDNDLGHHSVTVDLNGAVAVRAASQDGQQVTELVLTNSRANGEPMRFLTNREFLVRAISFGFRDLLIYGPDKILVCGDEHRHYAWMLLGGDGAIRPRDDAIRVESPAVEAPAPVEQPPARKSARKSRRRQSGRIAGAMSTG
jgi:hypothetical protein